MHPHWLVNGRSRSAASGCPAAIRGAVAMHGTQPCGGWTFRVPELPHLSPTAGAPAGAQLAGQNEGLDSTLADVTGWARRPTWGNPTKSTYCNDDAHAHMYHIAAQVSEAATLT